MHNKPPRIYISAMETEVTGLPRFDAQAVGLLTRLSEVGYDVYWEKLWWAYEIIEREIAACDALLAVVDDVWTSSTWMASEASWAMGWAGAMPTGNPCMEPIPVLFYPVTNDAKRYFRAYPNPPLILSRNSAAALSEIEALLPLNLE